MRRGEPHRTRVLTQVAQPQGDGVVEGDLEQTPALGKVTDALHGVVVHADGDELLQPGAAGTHDADRGVLGADEAPCGLRHPGQHPRQGQVTDDGAVGLDEGLPPVLVALVSDQHVLGGPVETRQQLAGTRPGLLVTHPSLPPLAHAFTLALRGEAVSPQ